MTLTMHTSAVLASACLLALAASGQRAGIAQGGTAVNSSSTRMAESAMPTPDTVMVIIQKHRYQTGMVTVKAGDVVVWRNLDVTEHTLTADSGAFESPLIKPGERWSFRFATAGTFGYHCTPHPFMKAEIHVRKVTP